MQLHAMNNYEKLKQRHPLRRDIILIIVLLLLILIAIIFPRFKELREPIQETEIIYIEPASDENNKLNLSEQQGHAIPPEIFPDTLDPDELIFYEITELAPFDLEDIFPPYMENLLENPLVISSPVIPPIDGGVKWSPANPIGNMEAIYANLIYPESEYIAGIEGKVSVEVCIGADSTVLKTNIYKTVGYPALDSAAIDPVKKTKWIFGTKNDQPVDMWMLLGIIFSLSDRSLNPSVPLLVEYPLPPAITPETELPQLEIPEGIEFLQDFPSNNNSKIETSTDSKKPKMKRMPVKRTTDDIWKQHYEIYVQSDPDLPKPGIGT